MIFDLIAAHQPQSAAPAWTPAQLFQSGEVGAWLDASDLDSLFQNSTGTVPVTGSGEPIGLWTNKAPSQSANFNVSQATTLARPTYALSGGKSYVSFDGINDVLSNPSISASTVNGFTLAVGQRKSSNESAVIVQVGSQNRLSNSTTGPISAVVQNMSVTSSNSISLTSGNVILSYSKADPNGVNSTVRVNSVVTTGGLPTTNSLSGSFTVGSAANDCLISQVVWINRILSPAEIALLETFIASKQ